MFLFSVGADVKKMPCRAIFFMCEQHSFAIMRPSTAGGRAVEQHLNIRSLSADTFRLLDIGSMTSQLVPGPFSFDLVR